MKKPKFPSELRLDLVSGDWIIIATGRARRPASFKQKRKRGKAIPESSCPFCQISTQKKPTLILAQGKRIPLQEGIPKNWTTVVVPNKFPAFISNEDLDERREWIYKIMNALGYHEVVITRDHKKQMAQFSAKQIKEVIDAYQFRYLELMKKPFVHYITVFHNQGPEAGASIAHPHSQILAVPLIDVDLKRALSNARKFVKSYKECIYCGMNKWERESKKRIVFENKEFLVLCPFASKVAFEIIISPKKHLSYFEKITEKEKLYLSEAFRVALAKLSKGLNEPAYNFYLHTTPCDGKNYDFYHWHWTILPKTSTWAGFELGAGMEISTIEPEKAAAYLRKQKV
ncbi:MAG: galactose-1-phosphate uridylyltransferase [Candidatus Nealsonbacteria bacterium CG03_land_8_20_14_0_80_36_12]|uniref:Galactose-1-phosphate uridylyltransferase n=1 Tax=Candidatus Nealsonbacteria bacterium CG03_land_8_20_14_0_80_36_12 TaxID=1974701 RepID=A0A2M7BYQ5_9BACT|nr:MAG: galactose-1-phosphate uridylyltransferase [Candidatus Nealsonbacteria bacterium CG03_land_8_20_14_0_80_36_12]